MILTQKTERAMKKIKKELEARGLTYEIVGNEILTQNCTIEINKGEISINEIDVDTLDDMMYKVLTVEWGHDKMREMNISFTS